MNQFFMRKVAHPKLCPDCDAALIKNFEDGGECSACVDSFRYALRVCCVPWVYIDLPCIVQFVCRAMGRPE